MHSISLYCLIAYWLSVCLGSTYVINKKPNTHTIDMAQPADIRWKRACEDYSTHAVDVYDYLAESFPKLLFDEMEDISAHYYEHFLVEPYKSEIDYFAKCMNHTTTQVTLVNLIYDFSAFCTSIIAQDPMGRILHGRNQDFPNIFRNDTIDVIFINSSSPDYQSTSDPTNPNNASSFLYRGTTFFGYVGMPTGYKPNSFSITIDARAKGRLRYNLDGLRHGYYPSGWLVRDVLSQNDITFGFNDAITMLSDTKIIAPIYYIIGGIDYQSPPQGAVVTRNFTHAIDVWMLEDSEYGWYLVETNYDHWKKPPKKDNRRTPAINAMDEVGQGNITFDTLFGVLSTVPVLNNNTVYSALMSASNDSFYNATIRFAKVNSSIGAIEM